MIDLEEKNNKIKSQISNLSRETLEEKFFTLYQYKNQLNQPKEDIDFSNSMIKRRFQYLNKTYTDKPRLYNALLTDLIAAEDKGLRIFLSSLYLKLELEAKNNNDMPLENYPINL